MDWLYDFAKMVGAMTIVGGGIATVGKLKFLTKKAFKEEKNSCQGEMISKIDAVHEDQKVMGEQSRKDMQAIKFFMGEVSQYMRMRNGGN